MPKNKSRPMWKPESVGDVIAEREFVLTSRSARQVRRRVRFGKPVLGKGSSRGDPWWCPVEVKGAGLDSLRPVLSSSTHPRDELASRVLPDEVERAGFRIEWLGDSERLVLARHALSRGCESAMMSLFTALRDVAATLSSNGKEQRRATQALRRIVNSAQPGGRPRRKKRMAKKAG